MTISVLVPYRPDRGYRDRSWRWIKQRWEALGVELIVKSPGDGRGPADFNHPQAINAAAREAKGDVFVIADADTAFSPEWVLDAAERIRQGAPWVLPRYYDQLSKRASARILREDLEREIRYSESEIDWRGDSVSWSGTVVVPREGFQRVGGYDERWAFWGADDIAFACSMNTLWGQVVRTEGSAIHLWHPRKGLDVQRPSEDRLMRRYLKAADDPPAMQALIAER